MAGIPQQFASAPHLDLLLHSHLPNSIAAVVKRVQKKGSRSATGERLGHATISFVDAAAAAEALRVLNGLVTENGFVFRLWPSKTRKPADTTAPFSAADKTRSQCVSPESELQVQQAPPPPPSSQQQQQQQQRAAHDGPGTFHTIGTGGNAILMSVDNESGRQRRERRHGNDRNYIWFKAITYNFLRDTLALRDPLWQKFLLKEDGGKCNRGQITADQHSRAHALAANTASHYAIARYITEHNLTNVFVLEDDYYRVDPCCPLPTNLPTDAITLINATIRPPRGTKHNDVNFQTNVLPNIIKFFQQHAQQGQHNFTINYGAASWWCTGGMHYPNSQVAQLLVDHFDAPTLETIHQCDFHLAMQSTQAHRAEDTTPLVKYVYYPALYDCDDYKHSTIGNKSTGTIVDYIYTKGNNPKYEAVVAHRRTLRRHNAEATSGGGVLGSCATHT
jgi:hypothetical protein